MKTRLIAIAGFFALLSISPGAQAGASLTVPNTARL